MPLRRPMVIALGVVVLLALVFGLMYLGVIPGLKERQRVQQVTLQFWGVGDDRSVFNEAVYAYQQLHPNVSVVYRRLDEETYEDELIDALAAGEPLDIVMVRNSWLPKHFDKLIPLTTETAFPDFEQLYPTVAVQDFTPDGVVYALPLYIDTLAMLYNRDIFDTKGIAVPPRTWLDVQNVVARLKTPVALGGSNRNISTATDVVHALFLQSGVPMVNENFTAANFTPEAVTALAFYTQFANPQSPVFAWSDQQPNALDGFAQERVAMMFGYQNDLRELQARNPFLPVKVAPLPQPAAATQAVNWARYYGLGVPMTSQDPSEAWAFISFLASQETEAAKYLAASGRSPALRTLINQTLNDPALGTFARQALSARSYPQIDDGAVRTIFSQMIEAVTSGRLAVISAVREAESEITRLIQRRKK